jgi:hypothetical protein
MNANIGTTRRLRGIFVAVAAGLLAFAVAFPAPAWTQDKSADNMQILRDKIKADKKLLVATNMELTESEAKGFGPSTSSISRNWRISTSASASSSRAMLRPIGPIP